MVLPFPLPSLALLPLALLLLAAPAMTQARADAETKALVARIDAARGAGRLPAALVVEGTYEVRIAGAPGDRPVAQGTFRELFAGTDRARQEYDMGPLGRLERGITADLAWELDPALGAKRYDGGPAGTMRRYFEILRGRSPNELYRAIERTGGQQLDGRAHVVLKMTPAEGRPDTWYVDAESARVRRIDIALPSPDSAAATFDIDDVIDAQVLFDDWRPVGGSFQPHRRVLKMGPATVVSTWKSAATPESIDPAGFAPPAAVTRLPPRAPGEPAAAAGEKGFRIVERQPQPVASIRVQCKATEIGATLAVLLPEVMAHLTAIGSRPAGAPFARYHGSADGTVDLEAGLPVGKPIAAKGRVRNSELPGGKAVTGWHIGPYEQLGAAHAALLAWAKAHELRARGGAWEVYWTDPGMVPDPAKWRTQLFLAVE